jgi:hypothetical protein
MVALIGNVRTEDENDFRASGGILLAGDVRLLTWRLQF